MISPAASIKIKRILPFGIIWLIFSLVYSLMERGLLGQLQYYPSTGNPYHFGYSIWVTAISAIILGLGVGCIEIIFLNRLFSKKTLLYKIVVKTAIYIVLIISFLLIITVIFNAIELHTSVFGKAAWRNTWIFFSNYAFWSVEVYIASVIGITLFYSEVNDNLGQGILQNFLTGKYHSPVEEERIFMFLDMKSSTTIAEKIGHLKYFEMLKEYFSDLTDPIVRHSGEIYQYVGDEIVVTWTVKNGSYQNNCIQCFYSIKKAIADNAGKYENLFGTVPEFKAGYHVGKVITGEIGVVKKEIIFTGDILNATARIQSLCNVYQTELLISEQLKNKMPGLHFFQIIPLGASELRGKGEKINLYTVTLPSA